jgi:hypothetical protein
LRHALPTSIPAKGLFRGKIVAQNSRQSLDFIQFRREIPVFGKKLSTALWDAGQKPRF